MHGIGRGPDVAQQGIDQAANAAPPESGAAIGDGRVDDADDGNRRKDGR
jgi:hypothetical protein